MTDSMEGSPLAGEAADQEDQGDSETDRQAGVGAGHWAGHRAHTPVHREGAHLAEAAAVGRGGHGAAGVHVPEGEGRDLEVVDQEDNRRRSLAEGRTRCPTCRPSNQKAAAGLGALTGACQRCREHRPDS